MLMPYRTLADPEVQGEGSIDALGLATLADHLADWMLPGTHVATSVSHGDGSHILRGRATGR